MKDAYLKYIIVGVIAVILFAGVWLFQSRVSVSPISALKCDSAYFNYVVGKPDIIVSAAGVDTKETQNVTCQFSYTDPNGTPSGNTVSGVMGDTPGGKDWRCHDIGKVFPKGGTKFTVNIKNDRNESVSCSSTVFLQ